MAGFDRQDPPPEIGAGSVDGAGWVLLEGVYVRVPKIGVEGHKESAPAHVLIAEPSTTARDLERFSPTRHIIKMALDRRYANREDAAAHTLATVRELGEEEGGDENLRFVTRP